MGKTKKYVFLVLVAVSTFLIVKFNRLIVSSCNGVKIYKIFHPKRRLNGTHNRPFPVDRLPPDVINRVEKFVFFIGYPRSGHSIVGSFMDAHPHMVIAHEFMLFKRLRVLNREQEISKIALLKDKRFLFNALYRSSVRDSMMGWRSDSNHSKNYSLAVDSPWLGKYGGYISVIGDKSGGMTANSYNEAPENFTAHYKQLQKTVRIPIKVIHCVRNPYDMVATNTLYEMGAKLHNPKFPSSFKFNMSQLENLAYKEARFDNEGMLEGKLDLLDREANAVRKIIDLVGANRVLELHNRELVNDPKTTLIKLCAFLEVDCSAEYIRTCISKVFKSVSKTRDLVVWPQSLRSKVEDIIKRHSFFHGYSFTSN